MPVNASTQPWWLVVNDVGGRAMFYAGIDYHKRYSVVSVQDDSGKIVLERRVDFNSPLVFEEIFLELGEPTDVVYEGGLNWAWLYEELDGMANVKSITVANPYKVRLIAEAQIKTDKLDARKLAMLLRLGVIPECHVPSRSTRARKDVLRQRAYWVRQRTGLRNRVHRLVERQHHLQMPQVSDMFGKRGMEALRRAELPEPDAMLLEQDLEMLSHLETAIKADEAKIRDESKPDRTVEVLSSIPGVGLIIGNIMATETDGIGRFIRPERYVGYAGLSPTTHSSGGKTYNGRMIWMCNKWLKWAFIEASWCAVSRSPYFGAFYRHHRARGKKANTAITIVARRMCRIAYQLLREDRLYQERSFVPAALTNA
jgi:transposase